MGKIVRLLLVAALLGSFLAGSSFAVTVGVLDTSYTVVTQTGILSGLNFPIGVAVDSSNNLYVANGSSYNYISKYDASGNKIVNSLLPSGYISGPIDIAWGNGYLYVVDNNGSRCRIFSASTGSYKGELIARDPLEGVIIPWKIAGVGIDMQGYPLIVDSLGKKIYCFQVYGSYPIVIKVVKTIRLKDADGNPLPNPTDVAADYSYVYVTDGNRIDKFEIATGNFKKSWSPYTTAIFKGIVYRPESNAVYAVLLSPFNKVLKYDLEGNLLASYGNGYTGTPPLYFNYVWHAAVDSTGKVYVGDSRNNRIQKFLLPTFRLLPKILP